MNAPFRPNFPHPAPRVTLEPDLDRVIAAVSFLVKEGERRGSLLTQYDIVKSVFLADRSHLNRFGRPITYDNYIAMTHGPVPSLTYDLLKLHRPSLERYHISTLPWEKRSAEHIGKGCFHYFNAATQEDEILAPSDISALREALTVVSALSFGQVRELTHNDPAYREAWAQVFEANSNPMSLGLLFDEPNFGAAEDLQFISQQQAENKSLDDDDAAFDLLKAG